MVQFARINEPVGFGQSSLRGHKPVANKPDDVQNIQDLLAKVPEVQGGTPGLKSTGKILGPSDPTVTAIKKFQFKQFGWSDGVVDPKQKTEDRIHELLESPEPPDPATQTQDILIRILGQVPTNSAAGTKTQEGQAAIGVPNAPSLAGMINTPDYLAKHPSIHLINFNGGGGRANERSDPTDAIVREVKAVAAALAGPSTVKTDLGKIVIYGWSSGGRNAVTVCQALQNDFKVTYVGIIDGAFDDQNDAVRTRGVSPKAGDNLFEEVSNILTLDSELKTPAGAPFFEFHGPVTGATNTPLNGEFYQNEKRKYEEAKKKALTQRGRLQAADEFFDNVHKQAVIEGHAAVQGKAIRILKL